MKARPSVEISGWYPIGRQRSPLFDCVGVNRLALACPARPNCPVCPKRPIRPVVGSLSHWDTAKDCPMGQRQTLEREPQDAAHRALPFRRRERVDLGTPVRCSISRNQSPLAHRHKGLIGVVRDDLAGRPLPVYEPRLEWLGVIAPKAARLSEPDLESRPFTCRNRATAQRDDGTSVSSLRRRSPPSAAFARVVNQEEPTVPPNVETTSTLEAARTNPPRSRGDCEQRSRGYQR